MEKVENKEKVSKKKYLTPEEQNQITILQKKQQVLNHNKDLLVEMETTVFKYKKDLKVLKKEIPELKKEIEKDNDILTNSLRLKYGDFNLGENFEVIKVGN